MEPFADLSLSDDALDDLIGKVSAEEKKISYDRRILHGKLDILHTERTVRIESGSRAHVAVEQLASILSRKTTADQRS